MQSKSVMVSLTATALLCAAAIWAGMVTGPDQVARAADSTKADSQPKVVEDDMHEFMEYVFQPTYKRLKAAMAEEPADRAGWKPIKADSLILAEGGNLLLIRQPEENAADWVATSVAVREAGGELYRAAKARDYKTARQSYETMLKSCNECHNKFADGEHQLTP